LEHAHFTLAFFAIVHVTSTRRDLRLSGIADGEV
jgi:hypothetical protein